MPVTQAEHDRRLKVPAVCELLPLRDLPLGDNIMVRTNGAFVAGYELKGLLAYFATDGDRNQNKSMLEALFRSVSDVSMRIQFRYEISEHLGDLLNSYIHEQRTEQSEVMALDSHRLRMWRQKENCGYFFENRLHVYLIWDPRIHAKLYHSTQQNRGLGGFTLSQSKAIQRARREHETYLAEFESILRGIEGSMEAANLGPRRLSTQELFEELKHAQHPIRRDRRPYVPPEEMIEYRSARSQAVEASILNETETYLNIDGYLYAVVSLKELPDATFPGMLQNFSTLGFPVVVSGQVVIPDQVKVLKSYKKRLQKMTAAQKDANGNFKSNPEAEVAQAQLIQVQRDIISSSLKTAKLSLSVVVRTSQPAITLHDLERSERELANRTQEVLNGFTHMNGAKAVAETIAKRRIFLGTLPGMAEADKRDQDMLTSNAADLVPVEMPWTGTRRSPLILFETPYRQLIPFSMFDPDLSDANGLLMAKSGGGKTLAAQQMLLMAARANPLISILERGDSYQPLVELMGGEMIEMSLDSDQTINPWDLPRDEDRPSNDQISFLKNLTRHMLGENTPTLLKVAVVVLAVIAILPTRANGQFGIDTAAIMAALSKMQSLMNTYIAAPLRTINQYEQSTSKYEQEVMYPLTAINQAKTSVMQFENQFNQVSGSFRVNVSSATLPQSQNLEALLLSRNAANVPTITGQFQNVYGVVMPQNAASPQIRTMTDMTDAQAQDAMKRAIEIDALADAELNEANKMGQQISQAAPGSAGILEAEADVWVVRANAYTQAALAELMRTRGIDLANQSKASKFATADNTNNNGLINGALTNR
jgi:hypothetical protein